jgi:PPOX class probable F420-dependent enzyme
MATRQKFSFVLCLALVIPYNWRKRRTMSVYESRNQTEQPVEPQERSGVLGGVAPLIHSHRIGFLATADAVAVPHLVPICFVVQEGVIYSAIDHKPKRRTGYRMKRIQNMITNPHVAFLVQHYEEDWEQLYYVMVRGTAEILEQGNEREHALNLLEEKYPQYRERQLAASAGLVVKIVPEKVQQWSWKHPLLSP